MPSSIVTIDKTAGFCFGVTGAIRKAEEELKQGSLYCLGDIVHNGQEVERLAQQGLVTIDNEQYKGLTHARVLLRAHGEPPETYQIAKDNGIEIIDASCPVVLHLQKRIRETYEKTQEDGGQILIFGKPGHAEVIGLQGQTHNTAIVIENEADLEKVDFSRPVYLFSQTTMSIEAFQSISEAVCQRSSLPAKRSASEAVYVYDTICRNVANRVDNIRQFAAEQDIVFFVGGKKSSNAKVLFEHCKQANPNSYFIENADDLNTISPSSFVLAPYSKIGITGATSTPLWLMEQVRSALLNFKL